MSPTATVCCIVLLVMHLAMMCCCSGNEGNSTSGCTVRERNALLKLKVSFSDPSNRLSSWIKDTDCCKWQGVKCEKLSGHVIALDLPNSNVYSDTTMLLSEKIDSSILELKYLRYLDLSGNDFLESKIPSFLGQLNKLRHLNLSNANFAGIVPHHLGNLSQLKELDLGGGDYPYGQLGQLEVDGFTWISSLSLLKHLDMRGIYLDKTKDLFKVFNTLPSIKVLRLSNCNLENRNLGRAFVNTTLSNIHQLDLSVNRLDGEFPYFLENMTSLRYLDLSSNHYNSCNQFHPHRFMNLVHFSLNSNFLNCHVDFISQVFQSNLNMRLLDLSSNSFSRDISNLFLLNLSRNHELSTLDLSFNHFYGKMPEQIGTFRKLKSIDLGNNNISGPIPASIGNLSALTRLVLDSNQLNGEIPLSLWKMSNLVELDISDNHLNGTIIETHFSMLSKLKVLRWGNNSITFRPGSDWVPPFQLDSLWMRSFYNPSGEFPQWLQTQKELRQLDISNSNISGTIPSWFSYINMSYLALANNQIEGSLPDSLCEMKHLQYLVFSNNRLSGNIPDCWTESLQVLRLSNNSFTGEVPSTLRNCIQLGILDLSRNGLSGCIPDNFVNLSYLFALTLSSNHLSGTIPSSIGSAYSLQWLQLNDNNFSGEIPFSLRNCTALRVLDIGENTISGELPKWIGYYMKNLNVFTVKSNDLYGTIPHEFCQLSQLQILDLASNKLTGNIPHCFAKFSGMVVHNSSNEFVARSSLTMLIKGAAREYRETLRYVISMDLSNNNFVGEIPPELTALAALLSLNLSHNHLQGNIPGLIGDMHSLESLDLSNNNLSGIIPVSLSALTFLSRLNLSYNNLRGEIPTGRQLQTLDDPTIYEGNSGLCGHPLTKKCHQDKASDAPNLEKHVAGSDEDRVEKIWLYGIITSGFTTGFWGVIGVLVFKRSWRYVYFRFTDGIIARLLGR